MEELMNNEDFLRIIADSFITCLETSPRSNEKLKILHGAIARDLKSGLGSDYSIASLGMGIGREATINGRYIEKIVDLTIYKKIEIIAGVGVKFVMSNYQQNSNNYFENMLGETANIRSNGTAYFQILVLPEQLPYFENGGVISRWEQITVHNLHKYSVLSKDDPTQFLHTPTKTLLFLIKIPGSGLESMRNKEEYTKYYLQNKGNLKFQVSSNITDHFGAGVITNNYVEFLNKLIHYVLSI